jgi:hypothetical protein
MRLLLGIILGIGLTIGGAYLFDSARTTDTASTTDGASTTVPAKARPMVNWDVVEANWQRVTSRVRREWDRLAAK